MRTIVTLQQSPLNEVWSYKITLRDFDRFDLIIPGHMSYNTQEEAQKAGEEYAERIKKENKSV